MVEDSPVDTASTDIQSHRVFQIHCRFDVRSRLNVQGGLWSSEVHDVIACRWICLLNILIYNLADSALPYQLFKTQQLAACLDF